MAGKTLIRIARANEERVTDVSNVIGNIHSLLIVSARDDFRMYRQNGGRGCVDGGTAGDGSPMPVLGEGLVSEE